MILQELKPHCSPYNRSYKDFWTRYYYRCDPIRIAQQRDLHEHYDELRVLKQQQQSRDRTQEVSDAALRFGKSAATFLAGAGTAVSDAITEVGVVVEEATASLAVRQSKGRPPFVMSAVEDDSDEYYEEENVVEIEESEEDEDGDGWNSDNNEEVQDEEVCFELSPSDSGQLSLQQHHTSSLKLESLDVVKLRQSLIVAEEQRMALVQIIDERNEEMCMLRRSMERQQRHHSTPSSSNGNENDKVNKLKDEVDWLKHLVGATSKDITMATLTSIVHQMRNDLDCQKVKRADSSMTKSINASKMKIRDLQTQIETTKNIQNELHKQSQLQTRLDEMKQKYSCVQNESEDVNKCIAKCQIQLEKRFPSKRGLQKEDRNLAEEYEEA